MEDVMQLMTMADGLASTAIDEMKRVDKCRQDAEEVKQSLPENPERGSYYWWARLCRQYTGAHFLDSGGAYGYGYQRGVIPEDGPHMWLNIYDGKPEYWSINTVAWLNTMLDADNEIALAMEKVLDWAGEWLMPRENWYKLTSDVGAILNMLYACFWEQGKVEGWEYSIYIKPENGWLHKMAMGNIDRKAIAALCPGHEESIKYGIPFTATYKKDYGTRVVWVKPIRINPKQVFRKVQNKMDGPHMMDVHDYAKKGEVGTWIFAERIVRLYYGKLFYESDFKEYQWPMSINQYVKQALAELPVDAVKLLHENGVKKSGEGFYTYNHDNDLSQDIHVDVELEDSYGDTYVILRTHNGADARGGFSEPVVAQVGDVDYWTSYRADGYCFLCSEQYHSMYDYGNRVNEKPPDLPIDGWRKALERKRQLDTGQLTLLDSTVWSWGVGIETAKAIIEYIDRTSEDEDAPMFPLVTCRKDGKEWVPEPDGSETLADDIVGGMYCPKCEAYGVGWHSLVYGF